MSVILAALVILPQEKPKEEKIVAVIPDFYLPEGRFAGSVSGATLNPCPNEISRTYFIKPIDKYGNVGVEYQVNEETFYRIARSLIDYGVKDSVDFSFYLNESYKKFICLLLERGIINREELKQVFRYYCLKMNKMDNNWIESAYYLTEAVPDLLEPNDPVWNNLAKRLEESTNTYSTDYFLVLCAVRSGADRDTLFNLACQMNDCMKIDLQNDSADLLKEDFFRYAKAFAVMFWKGLIAEEAELNLFRCYFHYNRNFLPPIRQIYSSAGLRFPKQEILSDGFAYWLQTSNILALDILPLIRDLGVKLPKKSAADHRDLLLRNLGNLEDIEYLIDSAGEDGAPELWKHYADSALNWHNRKENRILNGDKEDYYHMAVEGYRMAAKGGVKLSRESLEKLLAAADDLSVRVRDIIIAYELSGVNVRASKAILEKLEERLEKHNELIANHELAAGTHWLTTSVSQRDKDAYYYTEILWYTNKYGQEIIPFRNEIELAAYLNDPERTRKLSHAISMYALEKLKSEAEDLKKIYKYLRTGLMTSDSLIYVELAAIIDLYESLKFTDGARSLAQHLHSVGFKLPARRAFKLGGFEKEAEEQYFHWKDDEYWLQQEEEFNYRVRNSELEKKKITPRKEGIFISPAARCFV